MTTGTNVGSIVLNTVASADTTTTTTSRANASATATTTSSAVTSTTSNVNNVTNISSTAIANTVTLSETAYLFMRAKTIQFNAQGLKPNTRYYPFFDGFDVSGYCSIVDGEMSSTLTTDALGNILGNFFLPAATFAVGSHTFSLVDNVRTVSDSGNTITVPDPIYGKVEALYEANGSLKRQQTQVTVDSVVNTNSVVTSVSNTQLSTQTNVDVRLESQTQTQTKTNLNEQINLTITAPVIPPPPPVQCESWFFEYAVTKTDTLVFTVTTNSATPPAATSVQPSTGATVFTDVSEFISTRPGPNNTWFHTYAGRTQARGGSRSVKTYRQEWIGKTTDVVNQPSLVNYTPSGLGTDEVVTVLTGWTKIATVACPTNVGFGSATLLTTTTVQQHDPLAQSFFVDGATYPDGVFVTSIAVYFRTVDQATPVMLELRNMVNGLPGSNVFPGGKVLLPGSSAAQSPDASMSTIFRFDYPVYLKPGDEYCFVVKSTSLGYAAWCSKMGEVDVNTGKVIDAQPFMGTMFMSENNNTWIPDSYQDIKFDLNIATFSTGSATLTFKPQISTGDSPQYYGTGQNLPISFMSTTKGTKTVEIKIPMHGLLTNDKIFITGIGTPTPTTLFNNILAEDLNGEHVVTVVDEDRVTILTDGNNASKSGYINVTDSLNLIDTAPPTSINDGRVLASAIPFTNTGTFSPPTTPTATALVQPTSPTIQSLNSFTVYTNVTVNELMIDYLGTEFPGTDIEEQVSIATGTSTTGAFGSYDFQDYETIAEPKDFLSFATPRLIATPLNEALNVSTLNNESSVRLKMVMSTSNQNVSPVIDTNGMSLVVRSYKIDNQNEELNTLINAGSFVVGRSYMIHSVGTTDFTAIGAPSNTPGIGFIATGVGSGTGKAYINSELLPGTGNAQAKYKTIIRNTTDFFGKMQLFVSAEALSPCVIDAYVRTSTDRETHFDRNWQWMPLQGTYGTAFNNSTSRGAIKEWFYEVTTPEPFNVYDIKLVMRSTNNSIVPKIHSIRTITDFT